MALSEHLPIYKRGYELCLYLEQVVCGFSRSNKYGLGDELRTGARRVLTLVVRANSRRERESVLLAVREELEALKVSLRLAHDLKAFANFKSFEHAIALVVDIAKQNEGWLKSQRRSFGPNRRAMPEGPAAPSAP